MGYDLADIVEGIWLSLFEIRVTPEDPASLAGRRAPTSAGIVHLSGAWEGSVAVQCAESLTDRLLPTTVGDLARPSARTSGSRCRMPPRCSNPPSAPEIRCSPLRSFSAFQCRRRASRSPTEGPGPLFPIQRNVRSSQERA